MTTPAGSSPSPPQRSTPDPRASHPPVPRGLVLHLLDDLTIRGPSPEFWDRFWRVAPLLRPEEMELIRRAAGRPPFRARLARPNP